MIVQGKQRILLFGLGCLAIIALSFVVIKLISPSKNSYGGNRATMLEHATQQLQFKVLMAKSDCLVAIDSFLVEEKALDPTLTYIAEMMVYCIDIGNVVIAPLGGSTSSSYPKKNCIPEKNKEIKLLHRNLIRTKDVAQASLQKFNAEINELAGSYLLEYAGHHCLLSLDQV